MSILPQSARSSLSHLRHRALYGYKTPFLQPMATALKAGEAEKTRRWILSAIEAPIRRLKRKYPDYSLPRDCKRLGELYLENRVPYSQVEDALAELSEDARDFWKYDESDKSLAYAIAEGVSALRTKSHAMGFVFCYLTAMKKDGHSEMEIEKKAEELLLSYLET